MHVPQFTLIFGATADDELPQTAQIPQRFLRRDPYRSQRAVRIALTADSKLSMSASVLRLT